MQSMVGQFQWLVTLGRFDIFSATVTLARFRTAPRKGHVERGKRVFGYLYYLPNGTIRYRTHEPDLSAFPPQVFDWSRSVYGECKEIIPRDIPKPLGAPVTTISYVDANLYHDEVTGRSLGAALHFVNATPIEWYSKRQATVETATYGSEFVAARIAVDQIIDLRLTLRYMGVPIRDRSFLFGDNQSVVGNAINPLAPLKKRHHALAFHRVREAIASGIVSFHWIDGKKNPADILSKHWSYQSVWDLLKPILFWQGETEQLGTASPKPKGESQSSA